MFGGSIMQYVGLAYLAFIGLCVATYTIMFTLTVIKSYLEWRDKDGQEG